MPTSSSIPSGESSSSSSAPGKIPDNRDMLPAGPLVEVIYYTDPLCSWSWAFEPEWRRLRYEFGEQLTWRYVMGGLLSSWREFSDPFNEINRPAQMGPHWLHVHSIVGMPIDERIWIEDPPTSSYPACLAVKGAECQGLTVAEHYLRRLREAVMLERRNIARPEVLLALAEELTSMDFPVPQLDLARFRRDFESQEVLAAFREDLKDMNYRSIGRFPTLILRSTSGPAVIIVGYRPYDVLCAALTRVAPTCKPLRVASNPIAYVSAWERSTAREVCVACAMDETAASAVLDDAVARGILARTGSIYSRTTSR